MQFQEPKNNLDLFGNLFIVKGVLNTLIALIPLIYVFIGGIIMAEEKTHVIDSEFYSGDINLGGIFVGIGITISALMMAFAVLTFFAGDYLKKRKKQKFVIVMAILNALSGVLGILLCVFTLIELNKPEVNNLFRPRETE